MKKLFLLILIFSFFPVLLFSQVVYSSKIDSILNLVSSNYLTRYDRELSGDTTTMIGGAPGLIFSRWYNSPSNQRAAQYIYEKFLSFGLPARYQNNNTHNINVIARKTGSLYPNRKVIITAHYDNILSGTVNPTDTVYGADDNATGVSAVLEAARLLATYNSPITIEFVAFDEEEIGLLGSTGYADSCLVSNDTLMAVLNMDMIGWDSNNDGLVRIMTPSGGDILVDILIGCYTKYNLALTSVKAYNSGGSDHVPFWTRGFLAVTSIEPANDFHAYYHSRGDVFSTINMNYFVKNTKANLAALLTIAENRLYYINHTQIPSSMDTSARLTVASIYYPIPYGSGNNAPRLYYKINNGAYQYVNPYSVNGPDYTFRIPGQPNGTQVSYYIAAQDSIGNYPITSPPGGGGVNPPGTNPPPTVYTYYVWALSSYTSSNNKPITDNHYTYDTIYIPQQGIIEDIEVRLNLNHTNDGDLLISLIKGSSTTNLSQFNGDNGQNFTNTIFDDSASVSITQGTPPFTGRFRPQSSFIGFMGKEMQGYWILRIYDIRSANTGNLLNWSISLNYSSHVSVTKIENSVPDKYILHQNYPNPFNPATNIKYQIINKQPELVTLKVYDILGKEIATLVNEKQEAGTYIVTFNLNSGCVSSGIYFYRLTAGDFTDTKRMVILK